VQIGILGPFEVRTDDGALADVPGARLRALLIALALEPGGTVSKATLIDWIWGEKPPADTANAWRSEERREGAGAQVGRGYGRLLLLGHARGVEGGDVSQRAGRALHQGQGEQGAGALAQPQAQVHERGQP
jgi:hypothetical protein